MNELFVVLNNRTAGTPERAQQTGLARQDIIDYSAAASLCHTEHPAPLPEYASTAARSVSRRGVIWLGQTCNLHCTFCYFIDRIHDNKHPEHAFMPLDKAKRICRTLVDVYGNTAVDIEGGEPTLYPQIMELLAYCREIGLHPTLITNAITLDDKERCRRLFAAGVRDFKISIHGLGSIHDELVGRKGASRRQMAAIRNLRELGIPFRFNVVLTPAALEQLADIARLAVTTGALCVNWLGYNPHEDQLGKPERKNLIPNFTTLRPNLTEALDILYAAGIETTVRYVPVCTLEERHRECAYDYQQLFYDHREWDLASWSWTTLPPQRDARGPLSEPVSIASLAWWVRIHQPIAWASKIPFLGSLLSIKRLVNHPGARKLLFRIQRFLIQSGRPFDADRRVALYNRLSRLHARFDCRTTYEAGCKACAAREICSGVLLDYHETFGTGEVSTIKGAAIQDPLHYIRSQKKLVETADESWALAASREER
jgi:pyruvate-formate lyase-activating enzyme